MSTQERTSLSSGGSRPVLGELTVYPCPLVTLRTYKCHSVYSLSGFFFLPGINCERLLPIKTNNESQCSGPEAAPEHAGT